MRRYSWQRVQVGMRCRTEQRSGRVMFKPQPRMSAAVPPVPRTCCVRTMPRMRKNSVRVPAPQQRYFHGNQIGEEEGMARAMVVIFRGYPE